jgi:hypothetical protein
MTVFMARDRYYHRRGRNAHNTDLDLQKHPAGVATKKFSSGHFVDELL